MLKRNKKEETHQNLVKIQQLALLRQKLITVEVLQIRIRENRKKPRIKENHRVNKEIIVNPKKITKGRKVIRILKLALTKEAKLDLKVKKLKLLLQIKEINLKIRKLQKVQEVNRRTRR